MSAIVVNWNGGDMLQQALASLFAQTWPALEVILVDNGSIDGSVEQSERCFGDRLRVIRNPTNEGFARGNNIGFAAARGEWMFLLNSDAVCPPEVIGELMTFVAGKARRRTARLPRGAGRSAELLRLRGPAPLS